MGTAILILEIVGIIGSFAGIISLVKLLIDWAKKPNIEVSTISACNSELLKKGGTILRTHQVERGGRSFIPVIPAIYGSLVVKNKKGFFSETLKSCECEIEVKKNDEQLLSAIGAWEQKGKKSLEKKVNVKRGEVVQLHILRAIIQSEKRIPSPEETAGRTYVKNKASSFPILKIDKHESPLYQSEKGKIWVQFPQMTEAIYGGWQANKEKPTEGNKYEIKIHLKAENLDKTVTRKINFREWLKKHRDCWQADWKSECSGVIQRAKNTIKSI